MNLPKEGETVATPVLTRPAKGVVSSEVGSILFPPGLKLIPGINELYELELAYLEHRVLSPSEIVQRGAYFESVDGELTNHYMICRGEPLNVGDRASARLKAFFASNQFKTGYATHGLFPYRGKFHPQMIKALLNISGLRPGDVVLDPMMGSGTVLLEATLMGIASIGVDLSPFCVLMTRAKLDGLKIDLEPVRAALKDYTDTFNHFNRSAWALTAGSGRRQQPTVEDYGKGENALALIGNDRWDPETRNFLLLAYLDSIGYSQRTKGGPRAEHFKTILERYLQAAGKIQVFIAESHLKLAQADPDLGDARKLEIADSSVDGVLFSPPYSFAIDYVANDAYHLGFLGIDIAKLKKDMVGLRGKDPAERVHRYEEDMEQILAESSRVLRPSRSCVIVVGTNDRQLAKALNTTPDEVESIPDMFVRLGAKHGLAQKRRIERPVTGLDNVMRSESILVLKKQ